MNMKQIIKQLYIYRYIYNLYIYKFIYIYIHHVIRLLFNNHLILITTIIFITTNLEALMNEKFSIDFGSDHRIGENAFFIFFRMANRVREKKNQIKKKNYCRFCISGILNEFVAD